MKKYLITFVTAALLVMLMAGCTPVVDQPHDLSTTTESAVSSTGEDVNFRFLISDEENAIGDFTELWIEISEIGLQTGGESGSWETIMLDPVEEVNLVPLQGENAQLVWSGTIPEGDYSKVFIYITNIRFTMNSNGEETTTEQENGQKEIRVKLPSEKLQISTPFIVEPSIAEGEGPIVNFVYDITIFKAGQSGQYIIKPQLDQSGADQPFNEVSPGGKPDDAGPPEDKGKPEDTGKPEIGETEELEFEGVITELIDENTWQMEIEGEVWEIDVSEAEIIGDPDEEREAEVKGIVVAEKSIKATEVEIREIEEEGTEAV